MTVLVTGASGHLGNVLVSFLLEQGHSLRVLLRRANPLALGGFDGEAVYGDLLDQLIGKLIWGFGQRPDVAEGQCVSYLLPSNGH